MYRQNIILDCIIQKCMWNKGSKAVYIVLRIGFITYLVSNDGPVDVLLSNSDSFDFHQKYLKNEYCMILCKHYITDFLFLLMC